MLLACLMGVIAALIDNGQAGPEALAGLRRAAVCLRPGGAQGDSAWTGVAWTWTAIRSG